MIKTFKSTLLILIGVGLVLQLGGCFYWDHDRDHDRDRHYDHSDHHDHDSGIDVHVHG